MPRGRPSKRRFIDNLRLTQSREHENELPQSVSTITNVRDDLSQNNPNNITHENQASTSKPLPFPVVIEARNQVPHSSSDNIIHENQPSTSRPMRSAKNDCMNRLREVLRELNDSQSQESREKISEINNKRRKLSESIEGREQRQENDRLRASVRRAEESQEQRAQRLQTDRVRATQRRAEESSEQRAQRLLIARLQKSQRRAEESPEQRDQRLTVARLRESQRRAEENEERRQQRLEEQRRRNDRRQRALLLNNLRTYKLAVTSDVSTHTLGNFSIACGHCGALHFPEERVSNRTDNDSFGDCCLHGRIELDPPEL